MIFIVVINDSQITTLFFWLKTLVRGESTTFSNVHFFFVLETAASFYEKLAERLGFGLGSALLVALFLLMGSMRKWLQNKGIARSRKAELTGLRARHTGVQQQLCQLQETRHSKITMPVLLAAATAESDGGEQSFLQS
ncbi:MAG: hypothetical protein GY862_09750, partial [Gammaproteobacteria bacterium]|nr:hypothetical protein [Gammaproteobacteria bacterium]